MADEVITRYILDAEGHKKGAQQIEADTAALIGNNKKLETSFGRVGQQAAAAIGGEQLKKATQEAGKAFRNLEKDIKKPENAFQQLGKQIKSNQSDLAKLAAAGREGGKLFKALSLESGQLKSKMADLNNTINLAATDGIPGLNASFSQVKDSLLSLDFGAATRGLSAMAAGIKNTDFKSLAGGIQSSISGIVKLGASIISSPLFLVAGVVTGIIVALSNWGDSLAEIAEKNDKAVERITQRLELTTAAYEREIALQQAFGKNTSKLEDDLSRNKIRESKRRISIKEKELKDLNKLIEAAGGDEAELSKLVNKSEIERAKKLNDEIIQLKEEQKNATYDIRIRLAKQQTDADKKEEEDRKKAQEKSNENYKKFLEDRLRIGLEKFKELSDAQRFYEAEEAAKITAEGQKKIDDILEKAFPERKKKLRTLQDDINDVIKENNEKILNNEKESYQQRQAALDRLFEAQLLSEELYTQQSKELSKELSIERIQDKKKEVEAELRFAEDIGNSLIEIAKNAGFENAEAQKAFALFNISIDLARSLANVILGATEAAAATGPLAPFALAGYIASGTAAVFSAFAQISAIANQEPPSGSFAEGGYTGHGGKYDAAGIVHKGEFVATQENTRDYWDELNAIHDGQFEELVMLKYIQPALEAAMHEAKSSQGSSFADNIANSMLLNFRNKDVVGAVLSGHANANKNADKIVKAINKKSSRPSYRKK